MKVGFYNGYTPAERLAKWNTQCRLAAAGELPDPVGPCMLCGDPDSPVAPHSEDYSLPYRWDPPAEWLLCKGCHADKIHKRFNRPASHWAGFLAHIRRGGYSSDLRDPAIAAEIRAWRRAQEHGRDHQLEDLRPYPHRPGQEWFAALTLDVASLRSPAARPRP